MLIDDAQITYTNRPDTVTVDLDRYEQLLDTETKYFILKDFILSSVCSEPFLFDTYKIKNIISVLYPYEYQKAVEKLNKEV